jgi:hypothetical protein
MPNSFEQYNQGDKTNTPKLTEQSLDSKLDRFFADEEYEGDDKGKWIAIKINKILSPEKNLEDVEKKQEVKKLLAQTKKSKPDDNLDLNRRLNRFFPDEFYE